MKTPEQIRDMEFQKSTMGGYKQSDVELFLEEVASQIEILMKQKNDVERKLQEVTRNAPETALTASGIQSVLINAQKVAEQVAEDAKKEAESIVAEANLKIAEADIKAKEILAAAESNAVLLGQTAEAEATKIIANAVEKADEIVASAKKSIELEEKLYDRYKIEIADFKKKAVAQTAAILELMEQLPDEIPFNMERSKTVLSMDFSNPEQLLKDAVDEKMAEQREAAEAEVKAEVVNEPEDMQAEVAEVVEEDAPTVEEAPADNDVEFAAADDVMLDFAAAVADVEEAETSDEQELSQEDEKPLKSHISFGDDDEDDDDDDDDDEPVLFFRRRKK